MKPSRPLSLVRWSLALAVIAAAPAAGQSADPVVVRLSLAQHAKRYCSGIWVSGREREEALQNSVLITAEGRSDFQSRAMRFAIDDQRRIVTATKGGATARARYFGDQGCVILPEGTDQVFFTPRPVVSALPDGASTPWPMGDLLPEGPLPAGVSGQLLTQAEELLFSVPDDGRAALVVVHKGRIVAERYSSGAHQDMQLESWSMAKSVTATLFGRLLQMGKVPGVWEPAPIPEWQNSPGDPRAAIRIADLLHLSSGILFSGGGSTPEQLARAFIPGTEDHLLGYQAPIDIFKFSASRPQEFPPNTVGRYRNSDPWLVGSIVRRTVEGLGEEYLTWPQRELFDRIGIRRFVVEADAYGNLIMTGYNFGTARDWARFGMLYLNRGMWNGERLLPEEFVDFVRTPAPAWPNREYGGLFWLNTPHPDDPRRGGRLPTLPPDTYLASGAGDQSTYIIPSRDLVIVVMSHRGRASRARDERETRALGLLVKAVDPSWRWTEPEVGTR